MATRTPRVKTVSEEEIKNKGINLNAYACAGPYPNVTGMKNKYWGKNAYCIRVGVYVYHVGARVYDQLTGKGY